MARPAVTGSTLATLGGTGVIAALVAQGQDPALWAQWWFRITFGISILLLIVAAYAFAGHYVSLPLLPPARPERRGAAFTTTRGGETITEGGSVVGYDRVSQTEDEGSKALFRGTRFKRR
jgi:hypothetical protein